VAPTELYAQRVGPAVYPKRLRSLDIYAFGGEFTSSSAAFAEATAPKGEADPPPVDWGALGFLIIFFAFAVTA
jgi:hypothetical protein